VFTAPENRGSTPIFRVYTLAMDRRGRALVLLGCLSLLGLQLSGLHMHVDSHGYAGAPHGTHVHKRGADSHDHEHETDVAVVKLGTIGSKHFLFLIAVGLTLVTIFSVCLRLAPAYAPAPPIGRRPHWRPPQRAPPRPLFATH
jgi:hypothetical protein